jgi:phage gp29-like protein
MKEHSMARKPQLLDQFGNPVQRAILTQEVAAPTIGGVRTPISGYPADGLTPVRLASILRAADQGDPVRYLELSEAIEERDPHYLGVLGTRKRSVSQIEITVEAGEESPAAEKHAEMVRKWLKRGELAEEIVDILDAIGKGYSFTEIIWDTSMGQWQPDRLEYRDPRWFRFERHDLKTPLQLDDGGQEKPLDPFKFIFATMKAKSGLALRGGIARVAAWTWMFKAYTQRDWAIFTQTYGQPLRIGKYGPGTSEEDRNKLFKAVANIAGDCAAIVPESMMIEFVQAASLGSSMELYEKRCDWLDRQTSKLVLGQTATTDAVTGGLGSGKEHREVQEDIERADASQLSAILNRDLIRPWVQLEFGPQQVYPRLVIARPEAEDLKAFSTALAPMLGQGLAVKQSEILDKFGLSEPKDGDKILGGNSQSDADGANATGTKKPASILKRVSSPVKYPEQSSEGDAALQAQEPLEGRSDALSPEDILTERLQIEAFGVIGGMLEQIEAMMAASGSLEEFAEMLRSGFGDLDASTLADVMSQAMIAAHLGGSLAVEEEANA